MPWLMYICLSLVINIFPCGNSDFIKVVTVLTSSFTVGQAHQLDCPKIVLDHVSHHNTLRTHCMYACTIVHDALATRCKQTIKYQMLHVFVI